MQRVRLGQSEISIPPLVFGGNVFGWGVDEQTAFNFLDYLLDNGFNAIDTADIYTYWAPGNKGGESEVILGNWLRNRGKRDDVVIHTKGGAPDAPGEFANANLTEAYLTKAVNGSLQRLGTDYIDLYYVHYDDKQTPPEETLGALQRLMQQGKIRAIAASNFEPDRLKLSLEVAEKNGLPRYACLQTLYNLYDRRDFEESLQDLCKTEGIGVLSYFSLAHGFLTGKYRSTDDLAKSASRRGEVGKYLTPRGNRILDALDRAAEKYSATPSQIALAWLMSRPGFSAPVSSATKLAQLDELIRATHIILDADSMADLDTVSAE